MGQALSEAVDSRGASPKCRLPRAFRWLFEHGGVASVAAIVFAIAIVLRVPSCYESFWLDELHSAWVVWGDFDEIASRAAAGHQSPLYFWTLWIWKQLVGGSELALRMSSVLLVAAGAAVTTIFVALWTRSVPAAAAAGLVLAAESNSLFFGTELRPYAAVIFFSTVALSCFCQLLAQDRRRDHPWVWSCLIAAILLAVLCQPTAAGVLVWLPLTLIARWYAMDRKRVLRISLLDGMWLVTSVAVAFALWEGTAGQSWGGRAMWASFASATHFGQYVQVWHWTWLVVIPAVMAIAATALQNPRGEPVTPAASGTLVLLTLAALVTAGYWLVSWAELVPLWHRRYFIAVLPMFAFAVGGSIGTLQLVVAGHASRRSSTLVGVAAALTIVIGLTIQQGTLFRLTRYPVALARRGEDWRGAVAWLRAHSDSDDMINLDSGLIEAQLLPVVPAHPFTLRWPPRLREYLSFPLSGPYQLDRNVMPVRDLKNSWKPPGQPRLIVISRRPASSIISLDFRAYLPLWGSLRELKSFGNVSVLVIDSRASN